MKDTKNKIMGVSGMSHIYILSHYILALLWIKLADIRYVAFFTRQANVLDEGVCIRTVISS